MTGTNIFEDTHSSGPRTVGRRRANSFRPSISNQKGGGGLWTPEPKRKGHPEGCPFLELFLLELTTGLRRGELLALRWDDLNVKDRILSVSKQVTRIDGELVVTEPKTKNSVRKVALSQQAVDMLVEEHEQHPDNPILFPSPRTGGYWSPDAVSRINRKLLAKAGIEEHVRFHDLRHTFATMALSSGVDVKTLSSMLGHYSAGFTLDTYTHITNDMQRGAAEKIGGFMETATAKPEPEPPDPPEESRCKVIPFEKVG